MNLKPTAIVLGGTNPHIALIQNLKLRGYHTILLDFLENSPAKPFADEHIRESTLNKEKVCEIAVEQKASLVISACIDHANVTACYVAEKLGLPKPYSYETALKVTDKGLMKSIMLENDIPSSKHLILSSLSEFSGTQVNLPVVVKPSDSTGSKGVRRANTYEELVEYFNVALNISRSKEVIIEEYVDGIEVQVDCFVQNNKANIIMIRQKNQLRLTGNFSLQTLGSTIPAEISQDSYDQLEQIANKIAKSFKINNAPLFIQAIIDQNDQVKVIEFAPRVGGGLSYRLIKLYTGFDFLNGAIDSFLNIVPEIISNKKVGFLESVILYAKEGVYDRVEGQQQLLKDKIIEEFFEFITKGTMVGSDMSTRSRIGAFIVKADSKTELHKKIKNALDVFQVFDNNNRPIMRKDIYKKIENLIF